MRTVLVLVILSISTAARADDAQCSLSFEDRSQTPWWIEGVTGPSDDAIKAKAVAAVCDVLPPADKAACRKVAKDDAVWSMQTRNGQRSGNLTIYRPRSRIEAGAHAKTHDEACRAALAKACALVNAAPVDTAFAKPACAGTQWFCWSVGNTALEPGTTARRH